VVPVPNAPLPLPLALALVPQAEALVPVAEVPVVPVQSSPAHAFAPTVPMAIAIARDNSCFREWFIGDLSRPMALVWLISMDKV
jgi:hypothetical protein